MLTLGSAILLAVLAIACGGSNDDETDPTPGNADGSAPSTAAQERPGSTTAPAATPTTAPPTVGPAPTPAEIVFSRAQGGNGTSSGRSTGLLGIVFADSGWNALPNNNRAQAFAFVTAGISEAPAASGWISNDFTAPETGGDSVTAQISADVRWQGVLAGNGLGGTLAAVNITLAVIEDGRAIASHVVHSNEIRESGLTLGGFDDVGSTGADFTANLVPGRRYHIQLRVDCEARSGFIAGITHCIFGPSDTYDEGFVEWTSLSILFS